MITYVDVKGAAAIQCKVRLNKRIVGAIYKFDKKFYYRPTAGMYWYADTFDTIEKCKASLEG